MDSDRKIWQDSFESAGGFDPKKNPRPDFNREFYSRWDNNDKRVAEYDAADAAYKKKDALWKEGVSKGYITPSKDKLFDTIDRIINVVVEAAVIVGVGVGVAGVAGVGPAAAGGGGGTAAGASGSTAAAGSYGAQAAAGGTVSGYGGATAASSAIVPATTTTYAATAADLLKTGAAAVKTAAGLITSAKIISDAVGRRRVLPRGADLPPGYTIINDLPSDGNLYPTTQKDSVSSDGVGFQLPQNSGLLLLAIGALAFMKG